jgi:hypothetical protein
MRGKLRMALAPVAAEHDLGELISLHAQERPLIRFRARWLWVLLSGLAVGVIWGVFQGDRPDTYVYTTSDQIFLAGLGAVYVGGMIVVPPLAAGLRPPHGPRRWVAWYETGLIDVTCGSGDADVVLRPIRFDQIVHVDQHRESVSSAPRQLIATSGAARVVAERDGKRLELTFHGYRHQDRFIDAARERLAGGPTRRTLRDLNKRGTMMFGELAVGRRKLTATGGLRPGEKSELSLLDVVQVNERTDGTLTVLRRPRHGVDLAPGENPKVWFSAVVPNTSEAAALITSMRNKLLGFTS